MHNRIITFLAVAALACACLIPAAAEPAPAVLTVDQAVEAALRNNLAVKSAATQTRIKKRANDFSYNKFLPAVSATGTALELNDVRAKKSLVAVVNGTGYYMTPDKGNLALGLTIQEVLSPVFLRLMDQTALDYQGSLIDKAKAEKQMTSTVKKFYYQLLVMKEAIDLTRSRLANARERLRQAQVSYEIGQGNELNYRYARANVENLTPGLRSMETSRLQALTQFQEILGFDKREDMGLSGSLDDERITSPEDAKVAGSRFDVKKSYMSVNQLENALRIQDATLLPNLIVQYTADPTLNGPTGSNIWKSGNWYQNSGALSVTLSVSLSGLIPGSDYWVKRGELEDQLALAREGAETTAMNASHDEENQRRLIRDSLDKIEDLKNAASDTKRSYELTDAAYRAGGGRLLDLQDAELAWQGTQIQLLNERLNLMSLVYDLDAKYETAN
jgi:outer membrane protein TolC